MLCFRKITLLTLTLAGAVAAGGQTLDAPLYQFQELTPRWSSPENLNGRKGAGGTSNKGAKGSPSVAIASGETYTLLDWKGGPGAITRIWITLADRSPKMLRSLKLEMYWDGADKPAVSVPLGDFFGVGLGRTAAFECALFANPEGRSFNCFAPMPFKKAARVTVTNESDEPLSAMFFDVDFATVDAWGEDTLYFHAYWSRDRATTLGEDFQLLPNVEGRGRFLGANIGVSANRAYDGTWWGEGEVKLYLDDDTNTPSLVGTGTEDYIGTAYGQGQYAMRCMGCPIADETKKQWAFYRYHIPDPIFFSKDCRVTLQQMGGGQPDRVTELQNAGVPLIPVTIFDTELHLIYDPDEPVDLDDPSLPRGWTNFYRSDDVSATAYFYLDAPSSELPGLRSLAIRTAELRAVD